MGSEDWEGLREGGAPVCLGVFVRWGLKGGLIEKGEGGGGYVVNFK